MLLLSDSKLNLELCSQKAKERQQWGAGSLEKRTMLQETKKNLSYPEKVISKIYVYIYMYVCMYIIFLLNVGSRRLFYYHLKLCDLEEMSVHNHY